MKKILSIFLDASFLKFILVGLLNFILLTAVMFTLYNQFGLGYWGASIIAFTFCSVISYVLNRKFSFKSKAPLFSSIVKFTIVIGASYFIAFGTAKPIMLFLVQKLDLNSFRPIVEQMAMILAQCIFTAINFLGQRLWAFKYNSENERDEMQ